MASEGIPNSLSDVPRHQFVYDFPEREDCYLCGFLKNDPVHRKDEEIPRAEDWADLWEEIGQQLDEYERMSEEE